MKNIEMQINCDIELQINYEYHPGEKWSAHVGSERPPDPPEVVLKNAYLTNHLGEQIDILRFIDTATQQRIIDYLKDEEFENDRG